MNEYLNIMAEKMTGECVSCHRQDVLDINSICRSCCGARKNLSVDHVHPESKGGKATLDNCQTLCKSCNSRKGAR